jgi:outer membrane lipoprotein-sorting protein
MKRRIMPAALVVALLVGSIATPQIEANGNLNALLQKMEKAHQELKSLKAELKQEKVNPQIGSSDTDYGTLIYKPAVGGKGRMRIDYTQPDMRTVSVVGENFVFYQPRINQVVKTTLAKASKGRTGGYTAIIGLDGSVKNLAGNYNIKIVKDEAINGEMTTQLHLVPKTPGQMASLDIWVSHKHHLPVQQKFVERNGDYTIVQLINLETNVRLSDDAFVVKYPSSTVVVDKI